MISVELRFGLPPFYEDIEEYMKAEEIHYFKEALKTISNHCQIAQMLVDTKPELLPTVLEEIFEDAQTLLETHCVEEALIKHHAEYY